MSWVDCNSKVSYRFCRVSGSSFGKKCKDWYQNLWQEEKIPVPLNPATSGRQLCTETQEPGTDHEKKCHSQLEAHVEFG